MKELKSELIQIIEKSSNKVHPLVYALTCQSLGLPQPKPILAKTGFTLAEVEMYRKLSMTNNSLTIDDGMLTCSNKIIVCDEVHCEMFKCITNRFLIPSMRIIMELLKDDYILADKKLVNNHRECGCLPNPFSQYSKVSLIVYYVPLINN